MPALNFLNSETKEKLQTALKEHEHPDIRERVAEDSIRNAQLNYRISATIQSRL